MNPFCITFAAPIGTSKSPIAQYIANNLNLTIYQNDIIRTEVKEDLGIYDNEEFEMRCTERIQNIIRKRSAFVCDVSVDRRWPELKEQLMKNNYNCFVISINLSKDFITQLYKSKGYNLDNLDQSIKDHEVFCSKNKDAIGMTINEADFPDRLEKSLTGCKKWLAKIVAEI